MATVRCTGFFRDDDGHGWSEQHDIDGGVGVVNLSGILTTFDNLMINSRRPMLAGDCYYLGCRASYKTATGETAAANILKDPPLIGTQTVQDEKVFVNDSAIAAKVRIQNAANTQATDIYLRGVFDKVFEGGVLNFVSSEPGKKWKQLADTYTANLIQGRYGWSGINPALTARGQVTNYLPGGTGLMLFQVIANNPAIMPPVNSRVQVNFARINESKSVLNRTLVCKVISATQLETVVPIAAQEFVSPGTFIIPVRQFIPYAIVGYYKLARRKTGRPFGVGRGRLPARARN